MTSPHSYDIAIIGGGIVGLSTARTLTRQGTRSVAVLEAESRIATHQTGHNSGVIHSGLYYRPGSLKAKNCAEGREALYTFCAERGIPHERCGKIVVAVSKDQVPALEELQRRGEANGLRGVRKLSAEEIHEFEPHCRGVAGLHVPDTGIIDFVRVAEVFADDVEKAGGEILCGFEVKRVEEDGGFFVLVARDQEIRARNIINCGGLYCDRIARLCGVDPGLRIVPFRGEYYRLIKGKEYLVNNLIYPVPDPRLPFLGVHFTRMVMGGVEAGPNAVLAFKREGYRRGSFSFPDLAQMIGFSGFWKMAQCCWKVGVGEMHRSLSKSAFARALQELIPEVGPRDVERYGSGVRAQAVEPDGKLVDDFRLLEAERMIHVLNAPSPAATASISIGATIADLAEKLFQG